MRLFFIISFILSSVVSFVYSAMGFWGKNIILDPSYIKASNEEKEYMNIKGYRIQGAIIFLFLGSISLVNVLRIFLHRSCFTYIGLALLIIGAIYVIVSHHALKKK